MQIDTELKEVKSAFDDLAKDNPKPVSTASEGTQTHPSDVTAADSPSQPPDSTDHLKAALDRQSAAEDKASVEQSSATDGLSDDTTEAADTNKGSAP
jgi:hypothetical protein